MSEEENSLNIPKPNAAMLDALKAWDKLSTLPEDSQQEVGFAYSSKPFTFDFKNNQADDLLEQCRNNAISELKAQASGLSGEALEQFNDKLQALKNARSVGDINTLVVQLQQDLATISARVESEAAGKAAAAHRAEINAMHRDLYNNDAEYREATDRISEKASTLLQESDSRQADLDKIASDNGLKTQYDEEVKLLRQQLDEAQANGDHLEARRIQAFLTKTQIQQNEERIKQAPPEVKTHLESESQNLAKSYEKAVALLKEQQKEFIEAREREKEGKSAEEHEKEIQWHQNRFKEDLKKIEEKGSVEGTKIAEERIRLLEDVNNKTKLDSSVKHSAGGGEKTKIELSNVVISPEESKKPLNTPPLGQQANFNVSI